MGPGPVCKEVPAVVVTALAGPVAKKMHMTP
jgi:hypothetical protein